jgi:hypothetical protein
MAFGKDSSIMSQLSRKPLLREWVINKENMKTLLILLVLLVLGIVMVLAMKMMVSMETTAIIIVLLPLLGFLFLGGAIAEFGFGGMSAKFARAANEEISLPKLGDMRPEAKDFDQVGHEGGTALERMLRDYELSETKSIVLSLKLGNGDYDREKLMGFIEHLSLHRSFKLVVFLDKYNHFIACMPCWAVRQLLIHEKEGQELIDAINGNHPNALLESPMFVKEALNSQSTNVEALRQMTELNIDTLVVIDKDRCLEGVVERDLIVNRMMLVLLGKPATKL